jgi:hypothetical protein
MKNQHNKEIWFTHALAFWSLRNNNKEAQSCKNTLAVERYIINSTLNNICLGSITIIYLFVTTYV